MALKAGVFGLSAGSSPVHRQAWPSLFRGEVGPVLGLLWSAFASRRAVGCVGGQTSAYAPLSPFRHRSTANSELARTRGIRLFN